MKRRTCKCICYNCNPHAGNTCIYRHRKLKEMKTIDSSISYKIIIEGKEYSTMAKIDTDWKDKTPEEARAIIRDTLRGIIPMMVYNSIYMIQNAVTGGNTELEDI